MHFDKWLNIFLEEKGIDTEQILEIEFDEMLHFLPIQIVIEGMKNLDLKTQKKVKTILVKIDFMNGDVMHFIKQLGEGYIAKNYNQKVGA